MKHKSTLAAEVTANLLRYTPSRVVRILTSGSQPCVISCAGARLILSIWSHPAGSHSPPSVRYHVQELALFYRYHVQELALCHSPPSVRDHVQGLFPFFCICTPCSSLCFLYRMFACFLNVFKHLHLKGVLVSLIKVDERN